MTPQASTPPRCGWCGGPVGVYEVLGWRRPDGTVESCGWLQAREDPEHVDPRSAFFHRDCAPHAD